jgi:anti-anti-sigma factor
MRLNLLSELKSDAAVLHCAGQFMAETHGSDFRQRVKDLLEQRRTVIVDLGGLDYIDSAALSILVGLYSTARTAGGEVKYQNLSTSVSFRKSQAAGSLAA